MKTLLEKLNREELVNAIGKSFNEYHEFIYKCVRNNVIIPDTILNDYLNEHIRIAKKESYPPTYMDYIVKIWYEYAYNLLEKNIEIPKIVLKAISRSSQQSANLIDLLLRKNKDVPDIILRPLPARDVGNRLINRNKEVPDFLLKTISKNPKDSYWFSIELMNHGKEIPDFLLTNLIKSEDLFDDALRSSLKDHLEKRGMKVPDTLKNRLEKESAVVNEKLDKEELTGVIANNPDASWELIDMCIKNRFIIPDAILNNYFKDHPIFSEKEIPSIGLHILINKWHIYAHNLLRKNIDIPEIVLKAVSKHMGLSSNLIGDFINAKKDVPEILIKSISSSPKDSYWVARYFIERDKEVPEILNQSIAKEPMLLQTYKEFLKDIELKKKVKEAYASKEEVKESAVINEKLDKEELLKSVKDFVTLALNFIDMDKDVPDEILKKLNIESTYDIILSLVDRKKKIPEILLINITEFNSPFYRYWQSSLAQRLKQKGFRVPDILKNALERDLNLNESAVINEKLDKEELLQATANDPFESFALAKKYVEKYKEPPEELVRGLTKRKKEEWTGSDYNHSVSYAMLAIDHGIKVPDYVLQSILENEYDAYDYLVKMIKEKRIIPDNFLNVYFEKYYNSPEALEQNPIFGEDYTYSKDVEMWYKYTEFLLHENLEIPENVIYAISKSIYYSERTIEHLLYKKRDVPDILVKAVSLSPRYSYYSAVGFIQYGKEVPEILNQSISKDPAILDMYDEFLSERKEKEKLNESVVINEKLDKEELVNTIQKNPDDYHEFIHQCIRNSAIIPDKILNDYFKDHPLISKKEDIPPTYINHLVQTLFTYAYFLLEKNIEIPEIILKAISRSSQYSNDLIAGFLNKKINVPEILIKSVSLNPTHSYCSAVNFTKNNREVPEILNQTIAKNPMILHTYKEFLREIELKRKLNDIESSKEVNESVVINEKLDKEELKQAFLKSPNIVFNYVKKHFLSKNENPPEEFINAIAQSSYTSKKYIDITIHTELKAPKILIQRIIQDGDMSLNLLRTKYNVYNNEFDSDFPDLESISDQDLLKSITKESYLSFAAYQIYKGKGIKIPLILWKSILSSPTASLYVARELLQNNEPIPEAIIKGVASKVENAFAFAFDLLKKRMDLPETLLKTLAENPDMARIEHNFDNLIITYAELGKEIPDILIDGAANKKWRDTDLRHLCLKFASKGLKIPDKILDIFIEKTPKHGTVHHLGAMSYAIVSRYLEYGPWNLIYRASEEAFKIIPSKLYQYIITPDLAGVSQTKKLIQGFLSNFNKIPEDFKQAIIDNYKEFGHKIPKDIADAAGIKQPETINEKLDKKELLNTFVAKDMKAMANSAKMLLKLNKEIPQVFIDSVKDDSSFSNALAQKMLEFNKKIPDELLETIAKSQWPPYYFAKKCIELDKKIPEIILKSIARNPGTSVDLVRSLVSHDKEIPEIISKAVARNPWQTYNYIQIILDDETKRGSRKEIPQIIIDSIVDDYTDPHVAFSVQELFERYNKKIPENIAKLFAKKLVNYKPEPIEEKLDKEELLDAVIKDKYQVNQLVFNFATNNKKIPEKLAEHISQNWNPSLLYQIATDIIKYSNQDVPEMILQGIAKSNSLSNETALLYKNYYLEIPDVIMNALTPKQKEFYNSVWFSTQKPINEKLDKSELLDVIADNLDKNDILDFALGIFHANAKLPDNIFEIIAERPSWASDYIMDTFGKSGFKTFDENRKDVSILLNNISNDPYASGSLARKFIATNIKVPDILLNGILKNKVTSENIFQLYDRKKIKIPDILKKAYNDYNQQQLTSTRNVAKKMLGENITEKLDKGELLGAIQNDYDAYIEIMDHYFRRKKEYPPKEFLKMATETDEASRIFAEYCLEMKKEIPEEVIKKVAENPRSAYTIAALMILEERKVPKILIKSIYTDPLSKKQFIEFAKSEEYRTYLPTLYYAKI